MLICFAPALAQTPTVLGPVTLTPTTLPNGTVAAAYSQTIGASGGLSPYTFVVSGSLPNGLTLSVTGILSGTPSAGGPFAFSVIATDSNGNNGSQSYTLTIDPIGQSIANLAALPASPVYASGGSFTVSATATSGLPVTFSIAVVSASICSLSGNTATMLAAGICVVLADQVGDANYLAAPQATLNVPISKAISNTALATPGTTSVFGQSVTFTATITSGNASPIGSMTFTDGGSALSGCNPVALSGGQAVCQTAGLAVGVHSIAATYTGDANTLGSTSSALTQIVTKALTTTTLTPPGAIALGNTVSVSVAVAIVNPGAGSLTGTVTIGDGGSGAGDTCTFTLPSASCSLTPSAAGGKTLTASYVPDAAANANFTGSTTSGSLTVSPATSGTALASSSNPSVFGQSVTFTAAVTPTSGGVVPTGTVTFNDRSASLCGAVPLTAGGGNAVALCTTSALAVGGHSITVNYSGDANTAASSATLTQAVSAAPPITAIVAAPALAPALLALLALLTAGIAAYALRSRLGQHNPTDRS